MGKRRIRRTLFASTAMAFLTAAGAVPALAQSSTESLVTILASKGILSTSEANAISSAPAGAQEDRLVALLRKKGVLADGDVKTLRSKPRPAAVASGNPSSAPMASVPPGPGPMIRKAPIEIGGFEITPVGYIALTSVTRSTNTGNPTATSFGAIPFDNTIQGNIGETRLTAQNTRLGLRAHGGAFGMDGTGCVEGDFNWNDHANVFVNANSHTFRLRLAYADVKAGQFETSFGQMYSWLTPNRRGIGPDPSDVFLTNNIDQSFQVGLPWARQPGARVVWPPTPPSSFGVGVENPPQ